jgi:hypothetical protein
VQKPGELGLAEAGARVLVPEPERLVSACSVQQEPRARQPPGGAWQACPAGPGVLPQAHWVGRAARVLEPPLVKRFPQPADASVSEVVGMPQERSQVWDQPRAALRVGAPERSEVP